MRKWLKELREKKNLKQGEVAELLGVVQSYYCMIENGERQAKMTIETAQKLAKVLDVPLELILKYEN